VGAGIHTIVGKRLAELDDLVLQGFSDALRTAPRPPGARLESGLPLRVEAPAELIDPPGLDSLVAGPLRLGPPLDPDRGDHQPRKRHRRPLLLEVGTMSRDRAELCY